MASHHDYSSQLARTYTRGHPIANPQPGIGKDGQTLRPIGIGDVGYISHVHGNFIRMFNVHLEPGVDGQPGLDDLPDGFEPLSRGQMSLSYDKTPIFNSQGVSASGIKAGASGPFLEGSIVFGTLSERGAILATPDLIECHDAQNILSYKSYTKEHVERWLHFAVHKLGLEIALEDVILVTGVDLTTSWATATFSGVHLDASFGLEVQIADTGEQLASQFSWKHAQGASVNFGPTTMHPRSQATAGTDTPRDPLNTNCNQSLFIRHIRAKRRPRWLGLKLKTNGKIHEDGDCNDGSSGDLDNDGLDLINSPEPRKFTNHLDLILDYILERSNSKIAIAHDEDLALLSSPRANPMVDISEGFGMLRRPSSPQTASTTHLGRANMIPSSSLKTMRNNNGPPSGITEHASSPLPISLRTSHQPQPSGCRYAKHGEQHDVSPMIDLSQMPLGVQGRPASVSQHMLIHGYIATTFGTYGEKAYCAIIKCGLEQIPLMFSMPGCTGVYTVPQNALPHLPQGLQSADGTPAVLLDRIIDQTRGPVVPQEVWMPKSPRVYDQHVLRAVLRPPIFFVQTDGSVGIPLSQIILGNIAVHNPTTPVDVGRSSIHLRIKIQGYVDRKRQWQTQESGQWIQLRRLIGHVGRGVDKYLREAECDPEQPVPRIRIGEGGIATVNVVVVGVVHIQGGP
ncbi:unnamed protein product [Peniophora sp. CBMAI 1063]|nr:unnamed protein product [Peniophora sp. CBMAI 1063]